VKDFIKILLVFLSCYLGGKLGLALDCISPNITVISLPAGIGLAGILLYGYRMWPAIFCASFLATFTTSATLIPAFGIAMGNTLEPVVGAYFVNTFANGKNAFLRAQDIFKYTLLAAMLSTTISPNVGLTTLIVKGYSDWSQFPEMWFGWWMGDVAAVLIITPFLIFWNARHHLRSAGSQMLEAILAFLVLLLIALILFGGTSGTTPLAFISLPVIIWIAFRFGRRETITAIIILEIFGLAGTLKGYGPFAGPHLSQSLLFFQSYIDVLSVTALSLAVAVAQKREAQTASDKIKDEFIMLASHELRTPMTAIKGLTEMILEGDYGDVNEGLKKPLQNIHVSSDRQIHLINELLDVSRLQIGKINYHLQDISLQETLNDVITTLHPMTRRKKVQLLMKEFADHTVQADAIWLKEILHNLIGNALKYTEKGTVSVSVHAKKDVSSIIVTDTGIGIAESEQDKLFGRFRQVHANATFRAMGSGLGLFIARTVARKMGGDIILEKSILGQGSTFVLSLPNAKSKHAKKVKEEVEREIEIANKERRD
jgi:signal transduction histidine kinase